MQYCQNCGSKEIQAGQELGLDPNTIYCLMCGATTSVVGNENQADALSLLHQELPQLSWQLNEVYLTQTHRIKTCQGTAIGFYPDHCVTFTYWTGPNTGGWRGEIRPLHLDDRIVHFNVFSEPSQDLKKAIANFKHLLERYAAFWQFLTKA